MKIWEIARNILMNQTCRTCEYISISSYVASKPTSPYHLIHYYFTCIIDKEKFDKKKYTLADDGSVGMPKDYCCKNYKNEKS